MKDKVTFVLSILAFLISGSSFYFSSLRQVDDLQVIITNELIVKVDREAGNISVSGTPTAVIINSGTRAAAIVLVGVVIRQKFDDKSEDCGEVGIVTAYSMHAAGQTILKYDEAPLSIKGDDVTPRTLKFGADFLEAGTDDVKKGDDDGTVVIPLGEEAERDGHFRVCMLFRVATPGGLDAFRAVSLVIYDVKRKEGDVTWDDATITVTNLRMPVALIKRKALVVFGR